MSMRIRSLRIQLLFGSFLILFFLLVAIGYFQFVFMKQFLYENKALSLQSHILSVPGETWFEHSEPSALEKSNIPNAFFPGVSVAFVSTHEKVTVLSKDPHAGSVPTLNKKTYRHFLQPKKRLNYQLLNKHSGQEILVVVEPIRIDGKVVGAIQMSSFTVGLTDILYKQMKNYALISFMALFIGFTILYFVLSIALRPLFTVIRLMKHIDANNLHQQLPSFPRQYEIQALSVSLNAMLKRIEEAFDAERRAKERMRHFISDASHELRTPLTSIRGFLEVLLRGAATTPKQMDLSLRNMHAELTRIQRLVEDLLTLAKLDKAPTLQKEPVYLDQLLQEMKHQLDLLAGDGHVMYHVESGVFTCVDIDKIKQVILNLFMNAVQHTNHANRIIQMKLYQNETHIVLSVQDNGSGIDKEKIPFVFNRFYREENSRSRRFGGAGLGLSISKSILSLHGGDLTVQSVKGEGSIFSMILPLQSERNKTPKIL